MSKLTGKNIGPLVVQLENTDDKVRRKARKSMVSIGKPAVTSLSAILDNSKIYKARWEAAKALGAIGDVKSIPSLVNALEDPKTDVVWLAAEALKKFRKTAWPYLLTELINRGSESVMLRNAAHHVFQKQKEEGFNDLLSILREVLKSGGVNESTPIAASNILKRMREHS